MAKDLKPQHPMPLIYLRGGNVANSKFDMSLLEPIHEENSSPMDNFNPSLLTPEENTKQMNYVPPKKEGLLEWLPRDVLIGLFNQRQNLINTPYELAKNLENQGEQFGKSINETLPIDKYIGNNRLPFSSNEKQRKLSEFLPHEENDFSKLLGQKGNPSTGSWLIQKGVEYAPELLGGAKLAQHFTPQRLKDLFSHGKFSKEAKGLEHEIESTEKSLLDTENELSHETNQANLLQNESNERLGQYLNKGATHSARGASSLSHRLKNIEKYWSGAYKDLEKSVKNSEFKMEKLPEYEADVMHAIKNIKDLEWKNGKLTIKNEPEISAELQSIVDKAPTQKDITAEDFLSKYKDFRDARYDLLQRARVAKTDAERKALFKAYEESKPIEKSVIKALNEGLGPHKEEFMRINKGYSEQIYPLRENKVARKALSGKLGPNTIAELEGFGEGNELMRELIKQDQELLRNIVGQRYAENPEKLKKISESSAEYLYEMPEFRKIMAEYENKINSQLDKINQLKNKKEISLKQKIDYEKKSEELNKKLKQIEKDKTKIWGGAKKAAKYGTGLYLGGTALKQLFGK